MFCLWGLMRGAYIIVSENHALFHDEEDLFDLTKQMARAMFCLWELVR